MRRHGERSRWSALRDRRGRTRGPSEFNTLRARHTDGGKGLNEFSDHILRTLAEIEEKKTAEAAPGMPEFG